MRQYFDHPGFVEPVHGGRAAIRWPRSARSWLQPATPDGQDRDPVRHPLHPTADAEAAGPRDREFDVRAPPTSAQHLAVRRAIMAGVPEAAGLDWQLVYQSRSGAPHMPWLEPDINDAIAELPGQGRRRAS